MSLNGIAISGRGALAQAARIEAIARRVAAASGVVENGQRVGMEYGQWGGKNGQRVGVDEEVARQARRGDDLGGNRVAPVLESVDLIRALRALEANLQAIRIQDAVLERTVNEFARPAK
ncbi:MAG TPA: hypothetical protein VG457_10525 [Planctomycetota bacterium]|nr:hypothetical protein [Planctomycetota bacterium]